MTEFVRAHIRQETVRANRLPGDAGGKAAVRAVDLTGQDMAQQRTSSLLQNVPLKIERSVLLDEACQSAALLWTRCENCWALRW